MLTKQPMSRNLNASLSIGGHPGAPRPSLSRKRRLHLLHLLHLLQHLLHLLHLLHGRLHRLLLRLLGRHLRRGVGCRCRVRWLNRLCHRCGLGCHRRHLLHPGRRVGPLWRQHGRRLWVLWRHDEPLQKLDLRLECRDLCLRSLRHSAQTRSDRACKTYNVRRQLTVSCP